MREILCIGQAVIDCITRNPVKDPAKKLVYRADQISLCVGGDAVNEASLLSRLGHKVKLAGALGDDPAGKLILEEMKRLGVDCSLVDTDRTGARPTPVANLMVNGDGTRSSYNSTATLLEGYRPDPDLIRAAAEEGVKILSLASLFRAPLDDPAVIRELVTEAKALGMTVCADTKIPTYRPVTPADIADLLPMIDYMFPNENEGAFFTGEDKPEDMARRLSDMGPANVIIKAGADGCYICRGGRQAKEIIHLPAMDVEAVDSTGAGDSFVAGFLSGLLRGMETVDCAGYGTACAAACLTRIGAGEGVRNREEADLLYRKLKNSRR
ncbi:MAG: carbohydrate kinase family protein [Eubacterium sp.]|nr:carbohydrate kinase family protein [Eubacterium sp.]